MPLNDLTYRVGVLDRRVLEGEFATKPLARVRDADDDSKQHDGDDPVYAFLVSLKI